MQEPPLCSQHQAELIDDMISVILFLKVRRRITGYRQVLWETVIQLRQLSQGKRDRNNEISATKLLRDTLAYIHLFLTDCYFNKHWTFKMSNIHPYSEW